jgi:hypothetical protein
MPKRRELWFASLDELMPEVEKLLAGHVCVGHWSLGQICNHLATAFNYPIDAGLHSAPSNVPEDPRFQLVRQRFFRANRFPDGRTAPVSELVPREGLDDRFEADALRVALARFQVATGSFAPHPALGSMTKEEWAGFHCLHAAHHLGFVVPC